MHAQSHSTSYSAVFARVSSFSALCKVHFLQHQRRLNASAYLLRVVLREVAFGLHARFTFAMLLFRYHRRSNLSETTMSVGSIILERHTSKGMSYGKVKADEREDEAEVGRLWRVRQGLIRHLAAWPIGTTQWRHCRR